MYVLQAMSAFCSWSHDCCAPVGRAAACRSESVGLPVYLAVMQALPSKAKHRSFCRYSMHKAPHSFDGCGHASRRAAASRLPTVKTSAWRRSRFVSLDSCGPRTVQTVKCKTVSSLCAAVAQGGRHARLVTKPSWCSAHGKAMCTATALS